MNRRAFLRALGLGSAAAAVDPEFLLWRPGAKRSSSCRTAIVQPEFVFVTEIITVEQFRARYIEPTIREMAQRHNRYNASVAEVYGAAFL